MFYIFWTLAGVGRKRARRLGSDVYRVYMMCGVLTLFVWLCYPIAWGVSEGANIIAPDSEAVFYGVLDFLAKPVFSVALVLGHWNIDPARLGLEITYGEERDHEIRGENKRSDDGVAPGGVASSPATVHETTPTAA